MFNRIDNENEEQFLWRIGQAKDNGLIDLNWDEIANIINKEFRDDVSEYRSEAAYRKPYQQAKRFYEAGIFKNLSQADYISELNEAKQELRKEKQKMFDERTQLNKKLREQARIENDLAYLQSLVENRAFYNLPKISTTSETSDNDLAICISDFHIGASNCTAFGSFDSDVAAERLSKYLSNVIEIQKLHHSENAYVILLGDLLNGEIHFTTQLENRENVTEQIQKCAELLSSFIYELSKHFKNVYVNGVAGNHSRTSFKDQVLRGNRLDNLIPWYMKASLKHIENVSFIDDQNYDSTIGHISVRGHDYLLVHGDWDSFNESGVSKLVMMLGYKPTGIFYGHLHKCSYDDISGVKIIRSGSFSGTGDDYCISRRIYGKASQMVAVLNSKGVLSCYPVEL